MLVEFPDRRVAQITIADDDWGRAMAWARASEPGSGWLANPDHAARYGTSVRVAAERDVYVEAIKDGAVGMYDRRVAIRTRDRVEALGDFMTLTPEHARLIARQYDLDYLVTEGRLDLPLAFSSGAIRVYRLRAASSQAILDPMELFKEPSHRRVRRATQSEDHIALRRSAHSAVRGFWRSNSVVYGPD